MAVDQTTLDPTQWYTPKEIAAHLKVSKRWILVLIASGDLSSVRLGRNYRVKGAEVQRYLSEHCCVGKSSND
ncbi:MAG: helix-turn-helix domain-containing protein [Chloroflexota bacterium]